MILTFPFRFTTSVASRAFALAIVTAVAACASLGEPEGQPRKELVFAVTDSNRLISFNAGQPRKILSTKPLTGLQPGEAVLGIDYRVHRGILYALGSTGRLYTIDVDAGAVKQVGQGTFAVALTGSEFGFDFNPTVDRIRVASDSGQNLRLHPDSGAVVDGNAAAPGVQIDGALAYAPGDRNAGQKPSIAAAAYTYNKVDEKITTNFAIDGKLDVLVMQGSREGRTPVISPNTGQLFTVGSLGVGESARVTFDIADVTNAAFAAFTKSGASASRFYLIDLETGRATFLGTIGVAEPVRGIAVEP
jgi:hypothetical protein